MVDDFSDRPQVATIAGWWMVLYDRPQVATIARWWMVLYDRLVLVCSRSRWFYKSSFLCNEPCRRHGVEGHATGSHTPQMTFWPALSW
jgi:hypothetical protein